MPATETEFFLNHRFEVDIVADEENPLVIAPQTLALSCISPIRSIRNAESADVYDLIELKRAVGCDTYLFDWRQNWHNGIKDYRILRIRPLHEDGTPVNWEWRLSKCWPVVWEGPAFDALQANVMQERVAVSFTQLEWLIS